MDFLEMFNGAMRVNESKRARVEKALHSLQAEWKNLHVADSSTQQLLQDCCTGIQSRHERLNMVQQSVTNSSRVLEELMKSVEKRLEEVESREKGLREMHEKISEYLEVKMEELGSVRGILERGVRDFEEREKLIQGVFEKFCLEKREFEGFKGLVEGRFEEVKIKEKDIEVRERELDRGLVELDVKLKSVVKKEEQFEVKEKSIKNREIKLNKFMLDCALKMENVADRESEVELREKSMENRKVELDTGLNEFKAKMKDLAEKEIYVELKEKSIANHKIDLDRGLVELDVRMKNVEDMEKELEMKEKSIENRKIELDVALVEFNERMKNVFEKEKEVELKVKSIQNREPVLDMIEFDEKLNNVAEREKEVQLKLKSIAKREDELDGLLDELDLTRKDMLEKERQVELKEKNIQIREIELGKGLVELDVKMKNLEEKEKELELKVKNFENRDLELDEDLVEFKSKRKYVKKKLEKLEEKEKSIKRREIKLGDALIDFDVKMKNVMKKEKELRLKEKNFENRDIELDGALVEFDLMTKNVEEWEKELQIKEKSLENRKIELESKENEVNLKQISIEEIQRKLGLEKEKLEEQIKELEIKNKKLSSVDHSIVKPEPWSDDGLYADIRFTVTMDGNNLLLYLINHERDLDLMTDEVYKALGISVDPAKLVLDAMQGFYAKIEDKEFEEGVVCRSSILLLEQLRRISPRIQSYHRKAALELASKWKEKMKSSAEVIVFLQLLASYKLESSFGPEEFLSLFEDFGQLIQISELFQLLGYMGKISDLIQVMLKEKQHVKAVRYVRAFGLHDKFQPAPILKDFLNNAVEVSKTLHEDINSPVNKKDVTIDNIVASLEEALVCIRQLKLESEYSPESIEVFIQQLVQEKEDGKVRLLSCNNDADTQQEAEKNCQSAQFVPDPAETCTSQPDHAANGLVLNTKSAMAVILANMDGKSLQLFLNENVEDHGLICNDVFDGLKLSRDSAELVLDAIQGFHPPHIDMGDNHFESTTIMRSCILLLEQLMKLSPEIKPQVKEDAVKLALHWKAKTRTPLQILGFLHLITAYSLNSNFEPSELVKLFETVSYLPHAPQLCRLLRVLENSPNHTFASTSNFHCQHKKNSGKKKSKFIQSENSVKLVLNAVRSCYYSNLNGNRSLKSTVVNCFIILVQKLLTMPQQVHPHVQEEALKFALDWKTQLVDGRNQNPTEVFGLFHLLALFDVASSVDSDELVGLMDSIYQRKKFPDIVRLLSLEHTIPDLVESLIQKGDRLQAIRYIYEFKLVEQFPPVPILKDHISFNKVLVEEIHGNVSSHEPEGNTIGKQLASLEAIVKCIEDHRLEVEYPPESLLARIQQLKEQLKNTKRVDMPKQFGKKRHVADSDIGPKAQMRQCNRKRRCTEPPVETSLNFPPPGFPSTTNIIS